MTNPVPHTRRAILAVGGTIRADRVRSGQYIIHRGRAWVAVEDAYETMTGSEFDARKVDRFGDPDGVDMDYRLKFGHYANVMALEVVDV